MNLLKQVMQKSGIGTAEFVQEQESEWNRDNFAGSE